MDRQQQGKVQADRIALADQLAAGCEGLNLALAAEQRERMIDYLDLLERWNRAFNLTAVDQPQAMVARHLLDSLSILPWLDGERIMDSGTGAGLPGVPLAIACPARQFLLVDSNGKKVRFLRQVRRELALANIEPLHCRLQDLPDEPIPATITARALAPLAQLVEWHARWLDRGARLLAMKAALAENELAGVPGAYNVELVHLEVPDSSGQRCLAVITRT